MCVCVYMSVRLTGTAERLLGRDALVAGRAERGGRHGQRGEQVAVAVARLPLARFLLPLLHALLLFVLHTHTKKHPGKMIRKCDFCFAKPQPELLHQYRRRQCSSQ